MGDLDYVDVEYELVGVDGTHRKFLISKMFGIAGGLVAVSVAANSNYLGVKESIYFISDYVECFAGASFLAGGLLEKILR